MEQKEKTNILKVLKQKRKSRSTREIHVPLLINTGVSSIHLIQIEKEPSEGMKTPEFFGTGSNEEIKEDGIVDSKSSFSFDSKSRKSAASIQTEAGSSTNEAPQFVSKEFCSARFVSDQKSASSLKQLGRKSNLIEIGRSLVN